MGLKIKASFLCSARRNLKLWSSNCCYFITVVRELVIIHCLGRENNQHVLDKKKRPPPQKKKEEEEKEEEEEEPKRTKLKKTRLGKCCKRYHFETERHCKRRWALRERGMPNVGLSIRRIHCILAAVTRHLLLSCFCTLGLINWEASSSSFRSIKEYRGVLQNPQNFHGGNPLELRESSELLYLIQLILQGTVPNRSQTIFNDPESYSENWILVFFFCPNNFKGFHRIASVLIKDGFESADFFYRITKNHQESRGIPNNPRRF